MGITVVTSTALNAASANPASALTGETSAAGEFASLLVQQLSGTIPLASTTSNLDLTGNPKVAVGKEDERDTVAGTEDATVTGDATAITPFLLPGVSSLPTARPAALADSGRPIAASTATATAQPAIASPESTPDPSRAVPEFAGAQTAPNTGNNGTESAKFAASPMQTADNASSVAAMASQASASGQVPALAERSTHPTAPTPSTPVSDRSWGKDFGESVMWMSRHQVQTAQINLNPPQLGPVQVTLNVVGDQATAVFASPHAEVRQAITDAMPQLREMLAGAGINLGQANVGAQLQQQAQQNAHQASGSGRFASDNAILQGTSAVEDASSPSLVSRGRGLVDLFA